MIDHETLEIREPEGVAAAELFRANGEVKFSDILYSHVGPGHERAYFNLVAIAGYAGKNLAERPYYAPPFHVYSMNGAKTDPRYNTIPSAKRAVRKWIENWLGVPGSLVWIAEETGVHFTAKYRGITVGSYYFCPTTTNRYHQGFRVYFGGTYYTTVLYTPVEARQAIEYTFARWLGHARRCLL